MSQAMTLTLAGCLMLARPVRAHDPTPLPETAEWDAEEGDPEC